ncbi:hypothetical protein [Bradyrhizobium sp. CCBAU 51753]|uniref:hypothetical protein n=1 Tax=Bradyrhizobium sp. CCBAU 51753 TaxID=1325100 RepID=UPI00188B1458|nr:hypothetical protein [Bradyrhizobium sp. CCBAU 51753]QOZ25276.1 hypothetical protein XH93_18030 [Bradyrhizobium sp. CCBAU 51753]
MAAGEVGAGLGCTIAIGTTASNQLTDTYINIGEVVTIPPIGLAYDSITFASLADGFERFFKSIGKGGNPQIGVGRKASDAGQAACITALSNPLDINFRLQLNDSSQTTGSHPTTIYFKAKVMSYQTGPFTTSAAVMAVIQLGINAATFIDQAAT